MNKYLLYFLPLSSLLISCNKDVYTYQELRTRMHGVYSGTISDIGTVHHDQQIELIKIDDSLTIVNGNFYDSLLVRVVTVDIEEGLISCRGDSILSLTYTDNHQRLHILKDNSFVGYFMGDKLE